MNTIHAPKPAYGMPSLEGSLNKPKVLDMRQKMMEMMMEEIKEAGQAPNSGGPNNPGGGFPSLQPTDNEIRPHPPTCRPSEHPDSVPGSDLDSTKPGPGMPGGGPPKAPPFPRMESIDVLDGKLYMAEHPYAAISGEVTDSAMTDASYQTDEVCLNGLYIGGDSVYEIKDSQFELNGHGIDDFAGIGSAVMLNDTAKCEMKNVTITTRGVIRPCTVATGNSTLIVRNCILDAKGGEIPKTYVPRVASGMMEPPPGLKLGGNCRTHLSMGNSKAYFYDSKILAHSWAALSTDSSQGDLYLEANNCDVVCENIGYATYADGGCHNVLNGCRVSVATHVAIIAGDAWVKMNDCTVKSGRYGMMLHSISPNYTETTEGHIVGGSWDVGEALFFTKSDCCYMKLDGAQVKTGKYLIHSVINDDPKGTKIPEDMKCKNYGMNAVIANGNYAGDIVNEDVDRTMSVTIQNASVTGVICDAYIALEGSKWIATGDSTVCLVGDVKVNQIDAHVGVAISAVAGEGCGLSGEYVLTSGGKLTVS